MANQRRRFRVAERLHSVIASQLLRLSDPRLCLVTITAVQVSPDLRHARVYWVATNSEDRREEVAEGLISAQKLLRTAVGKELSIRCAPELKFFYDDTLDVQREVDVLMNSVETES
jgi:ribosome-binding factor A